MKLKASIQFEFYNRVRDSFYYEPFQRSDIQVTQADLRNFANEMKTATISIQLPRSEEGDLISKLMLVDKVHMKFDVSLVDVDSKGNEIPISSMSDKYFVVQVQGQVDFNTEQLTLIGMPLLLSNNVSVSITDEEIQIIANEVKGASGSVRAEAIFNGFVEVFSRRGIEVLRPELKPINSQEEFQPEQLKGDIFLLFRDFVITTFVGASNSPVVVEFFNNRIIIHSIGEFQKFATGKILNLFYGPGFNVKPTQWIYERILMDNLIFTPGLGVSHIRSSVIDSQGKTTDQEIGVEFGQSFKSFGKPPNFETSNYHLLYTYMLLLMKNLQVKVLGQNIGLFNTVTIKSNMKVKRFEDNTKVVPDPFFNNKTFLVTGIEHHIDNNGWFVDLRLLPLDIIPIITKQVSSRSTSTRTIERRTGTTGTPIEYIKQDEVFIIV